MDQRWRDNRGRIVRFKYGDRPRRRGELSHAWRGGRFIDSKGYVRIYKPNHPRSYDRQVFEHVVKYDEYHSCCLLPWGVIHHHDGNLWWWWLTPQNNSKDNLEATSSSKHTQIHHPKGCKHTDKTRQKMWDLEDFQRKLNRKCVIESTCLEGIIQ